MYPCKVPVILVWLQRNLSFLNRFSKNTQISNFRKILPEEAELFYADRQRRIDKKKLIFAFSKFSKAPKNLITVYYIRYTNLDLRTHSSTHVPSFEVSIAKKHHNGLNSFSQQKRKIGTNNQVSHRIFSAILSFFQVSHRGRNVDWECSRIGCCGRYLVLRGTR